MRNSETLVLAFKKAKSKKLKIRELLIEPDMNDDAVDALIVHLAKLKAATLGKGDWTSYVKGQRWYVESLIKFSGLTEEEQLDMEYEEAFIEIASEAELIKKLKEI